MQNRRMVPDGRRYPVHRVPPTVIADRVVDTVLSLGYVIDQGMAILNPNLSDIRG